jgi:thiol:disulfide interchange protein
MYAAWCGPCKRLKETTFTDPRVGEYFNANYINVALDAEKGEGFELARQYGIRGYPTLLFLDPSGSVIERAVGFHDAETLIALGKRIHPSSN